MRPSSRFLRSVRRATRIARSPASWIERRALARGTAPPKVSIDPQHGYGAFRPGELEGCGPTIDAARRVWEESRPQIRRIESHHHGRFGIVFDLLSDDRIEEHPALLEFALSTPVLDAVLEYLGTVPVLRRIALAYSPVGTPGCAPMGSQRFHLDREDERQVKLFLLPEAVEPDMGPVTFAPAPASARAVQKVHGRTRAGGLSVPDEAVLRELEYEPPTVSGPAGSGAFVDTSRCLHFGSRGVRRPRLMLAFVYQRHHLVEETPFNWFDRARAGGDRLRELILTPPRPCPPGWFYPNPLRDPGPAARGKGSAS